MSHEQSETVEIDGQWYNVYGKNTPQAGQVLPGTSGFKSMNEAVDAAKKRSANFMSVEEFAGAGAADASSSSSGPGQSSSPANLLSVEEFTGTKATSGAAQSADWGGVVDKTLSSLKAMGGETAALADLVLSVPGLMLNVGGQLGGTIQARARGIPFSPDPNQLNPVTAYGVGREAGRTLGEPLMNPLKKLLDLFKSGEAYEQAKTTKGMEAFMSLLEEAGLWAEEKSGGRVSRDSVPMLAETLMASAAGFGAKKPSGIPEHIQKAMREQGAKMRQQAEVEAAAKELTPEEFSSRVPVQQQINDLLGIRTPQEQAKLTRQRRQDAQQAFGRQPAEGSDFGSAAESAFRAEERLGNQRDFTDHPAALEEGVARTPAEGYEVGSKAKSDRIGQAEILRILQKPGHERTAEDLITLREARKQGGNTSMDAQMLLGAAGIGAAVGGLLDDDALRGAVLGGSAAVAPLTMMKGLGAGGVKSRFGQAGAVKGPGGMWHPEAIDRLTQPLVERLNQGFEPEIQTKESAIYRPWANKAIRNYLNRYAGTERDPLKDVEIPFGEGTKKWEELWDAAVAKNKVSDFVDKNSGAVKPEFEHFKKAPPDETVFGIGDRKNYQESAKAAGYISGYLSHVGDYLRQNVKPEDLPRYDLVRAVQETAKNDARVAKEMEKAQAASTKDLPVYKEYKDGFRWVELKLPEKLTPEQAKTVRQVKEGSPEWKKLSQEADLAGEGDLVAGRDTPWIALGPDGKPLRNSYTDEIAGGASPEEAWLAGRLAEEGNTMGHCVGGYCPSVASGESRIFSLRDPKGKSHVTIEVTPTEKLIDSSLRATDNVTKLMNHLTEYHPELHKKAAQMARASSSDAQLFKELKADPEIAAALEKDFPLNIDQIKGKQNRAPNKEYLPYVQDFVREGKWGEVGDLENTGLRKSLSEDGKSVNYLTQEEFEARNNKFISRPRGEEGFARQEFVMGLGAIGLGGIAGSLFFDDPAEGAILGALAGGALMLPGARARLKQAAETVDYGMGNISTRIGNASPALKLAARTYEMRNLTESHRYLHEAVPFMKAREKLPKSQRDALDRALLTGDSSKIVASVKGNPEMVSAIRQAKNVLSDLGKQLQDHGRFKTMLDDYFPRLVKDVEGLKAALGKNERTRLEEALASAEKASMKSRGTPLTQVEVSSIINREMQSISRARGYLPGFAKARGVKEITEQLQPFYYTPSESLYAYIRGAVQDLEVARFFGRDLAQVERGSHRYIDIDTSVGNIIGRELAEGRITHEQVVELEGILKTRFKEGERAAGRGWQELRNLGNIGLLGNIVSAATQGADALMAIYAHDFRSTLTAMARQATGKEKITTKDFGLADHIAEEFSSTSRTADWLNKMFKYSSFSAIDRFGKSTNLNAGLAKFERWSRDPKGVARLKEKYGEAYGKEFPQLVADLKDGRLTERVRSLLFSELSDMQPISKMELPEAYLKHPNGRIMYMLKTFMLKQMDVVRRDVYNELKKGNIGRAMKNGTEYALVLGLAGASTDMIKNWLMGRPVSFEGTDVLENVLKTFGWGEYVIDKAKQGRPVEALLGTIAPPYRIIDDIIRRDPKAVQYIPIVGKLYYNWELGGREEAELREARKAKKHGVDYNLPSRTEEYKERKKEKRRSNFSEGVRG